jgi:hypothetical protein
VALAVMADQNAYTAIESLLRPSEELKCILEARHELLDEDPSLSAASANTSTRILAIVTHQNARTGMEEGWYVALFLEAHLARISFLSASINLGCFSSISTSYKAYILLLA